MCAAFEADQEPRTEAKSDLCCHVPREQTLLPSRRQLPQHPRPGRRARAAGHTSESSQILAGLYRAAQLRIDRLRLGPALAEHSEPWRGEGQCLQRPWTPKPGLPAAGVLSGRLASFGLREMRSCL